MKKLFFILSFIIYTFPCFGQKLKVIPNDSSIIFNKPFTTGKLILSIALNGEITVADPPIPIMLPISSTLQTLYTVVGKEDHRLGDQVNIIITITQGTKVYTYDRYVSIVDWEKDPSAIIATMTDTKMKQTTTVISPPKTTTITLTSTEVATKLAEVERLQKLIN